MGQVESQGSPRKEDGEGVVEVEVKVHEEHGEVPTAPATESWSWYDYLPPVPTIWPLNSTEEEPTQTGGTEDTSHILPISPVTESEVEVVEEGKDVGSVDVTVEGERKAEEGIPEEELPKEPVPCEKCMKSRLTVDSLTLPLEEDVPDEVYKHLLCLRDEGRALEGGDEHSRRYEEIITEMADILELVDAMTD